MPAILFLTGHTALAHNDNHLRLPAAFRAAGWEVGVQSHDAVRLSDGRLQVDGTDLEAFDLLWLLGLGRAVTFFDRMQLLRRLPARQLVTGVDAHMYLHAKYAWSELMPETHAANDLDYLRGILAGGGEWVAKPTAGSYGRDVVRVRNDAAGIETIGRLIGPEGRYCLLQRFVTEITAGEKRTLIAGHEIIGTYLRLPGGDFRTNLAAQGRPTATRLTVEELDLVERIQAQLAAAGVGFAAIDTAYPYLMEVNLANPGGLATLQTLYGGDPAARVVAALSAARGLDGRPTTQGARRDPAGSDQ